MMKKIKYFLWHQKENCDFARVIWIVWEMFKLLHSIYHA